MEDTVASAGGQASVKIVMQNGLLVRRNRGGSNRPDRRLEEHLEADRAAYSSCMFKMQQTRGGDYKNTTRPVPSRCKPCYGRLMSRLVHNKYDGYGVRDSLYQNKILAESATGSIMTPLEGLKKFIEETVGGRGWWYRLIMTASGWVMYFCFGKEFDAICMHDGQLQLLKSFPKVHPVIYVPLMQSYMDHFVLSWGTLQMNGTIPKSLLMMEPDTNHPLCFFAQFWNALIKKFGTLAEVMTEVCRLVRAEISGSSHLKLECSLENEAVITGKPSTSPISCELMETVIQYVLEGKPADVLFVPASVTYEKIPETPKRASLLGAFWSLLINKNTGKGIARLNFAHPISVREFLATLKKFQEKPTDLAESSMEDDKFSNVSSSESEDKVALGQMEGEKKVEAIKEAAGLLSRHILYDSFRCTPLMSTHLLSFLLLNHYRGTWVALEQLVEDFEYYVRWAQDLGYDTGFSNLSDYPVLVKRAAAVLGDHLVLTGGSVPKMPRYFKASMDMKSVKELGFYSNHVASLFAMEAVMISSIFAVNRTKLVLYKDTQIQIEFVEKEATSAAKNLIKILQEEFLFHSPCITVEEALDLQISMLQTKCLISSSDRARRYYREEDDDIQDNIVPGANKFVVSGVYSEKVLDRFAQFRLVLVPYLSSYCDLLNGLETKFWTTNSFAISRKELEFYLLSKLQTESSYQELAMEATVCHFIQAFISMEVLQVSLEADLEVLTLNEPFRTPEAINSIRDHILFYL